MAVNTTNQYSTRSDGPGYKDSQLQRVYEQSHLHPAPTALSRTRFESRRQQNFLQIFPASLSLPRSSRKLRRHPQPALRLPPNPPPGASGTRALPPPPGCARPLRARAPPEPSGGAQAQGSTSAAGRPAQAASERPAQAGRPPPPPPPARTHPYVWGAAASGTEERRIWATASVGARAGGGPARSAPSLADLPRRVHPPLPPPPAHGPPSRASSSARRRPSSFSSARPSARASLSPTRDAAAAGSGGEEGRKRASVSLLTRADHHRPARGPWLPAPAAVAPRRSPAGCSCLPVLLLRPPAPRPSVATAAAKLKTLEPHQDVVEAPCPLAADCGGCKTQSLAYVAL